MKSPILYIIFNRIDTTDKSFETIRNAKPSKLYIAADGPRSSVTGEDELCNKVREIALKVDWDCEVKKLFQDENLGCKKAVVTAINWFFDNEEEGIILEDDIIPKPEFFDFVDIMLNKYRNDNKIKAVLGFNQFGQNVNSDTYFYSRGFYAWGWATWRSRWKNFQESVTDISDLDDISIRKTYHKAVLRGVKFNLNLVRAGLLDTWDYQMVYMTIREKGYTIVPYANLTSNIGADGAHSVNNKNIFHNYGNLSISDLKYPDLIEDNEEMNQKLWAEYKSASKIVFFKTILFRLNIYKLIRNLYKKIKK